MPVALVKPGALAMMRTESKLLVTLLSPMARLNRTLDFPAKLVTSAGTARISGCSDCKAMTTLVSVLPPKYTLAPTMAVWPSVISSGSPSASARLSLSLTRMMSKSPDQFATVASMRTFSAPSSRTLSGRNKSKLAELWPAGMTTLGGTLARSGL